MKKTLIVLIISLFSTSAFSYSCPMLWEELDYEINLAKDAGISSEKIKEIQEMRNEGKKAHDDGDHAKSEEILNKALELIKS
tara:strand:- start:346 stop:591 length:246 start_codon:yes stop_codon:yes gene_type:complete